MINCSNDAKINDVGWC